jgi:hypothetical protein
MQAFGRREISAWERRAERLPTFSNMATALKEELSAADRYSIRRYQSWYAIGAADR